MITIIKPANALPKWRGKCMHCSCEIECDTVDVSYDPQQAEKVTCPHCHCWVRVSKYGLAASVAAEPPRP